MSRNLLEKFDLFQTSDLMSSTQLRVVIITVDFFRGFQREGSKVVKPIGFVYVTMKVDNLVNVHNH